MPLDIDQQIAMQLAGTIGIPSPFPACACILINAAYPKAASTEIQLEIVHRLNYRLKITRWVTLDQVRAVQSPSMEWEAVPLVPLVPSEAIPPPEHVPHSGWSVKLGSEVIGLVRARLAREKQGPIRLPFLNQGIVFVAETTPILMQVEVGMTAAESAQYYPPLAPAPLVSRCESLA